MTEANRVLVDLIIWVFAQGGATELWFVLGIVTWGPKDNQGNGGRAVAFVYLSVAAAGLFVGMVFGKILLQHDLLRVMLVVPATMSLVWAGIRREKLLKVLSGVRESIMTEINTFR